MVSVLPNIMMETYITDVKELTVEDELLNAKKILTEADPQKEGKEHDVRKRRKLRGF